MKKKFSLKPTFEVNTGDFWGIKNLSKPKALLAMAALAALGNVLGFVMIPIGPQAKLDLTTLPLLIVACLYGPLPAFISGILGSLVTILQFGHPFSPFFWYGPYLFVCGVGALAGADCDVAYPGLLAQCGFPWLRHGYLGRDWRKGICYDVGIWCDGRAFAGFSAHPQGVLELID